MDDQPLPDKRSALQRLRGYCVRCVLILLVLYGLSNLLLCSSLGTGFAESKLEKRTGLEWEIGSMTWSPWNGFTVNDIKGLQPEELSDVVSSPVVKVKRIQIKPYWMQLMRGEAKVREVRVESPELTVPIELLASLAAQDASIAKPEPPTVAPQILNKQEPGEVPKSKPPYNTGSREKNPVKPSQPPTPAKPSDKKRAAAGLAMQVKVSDARLKVISANKGVELLNISGVSIDLPVFGEDRKGLLTASSIIINGLPEISGFEQAVMWQRPYLTLTEPSAGFGGVEMRYRGQLALGQRTKALLPFAFDLAVPQQKLEQFDWLQRLALHANAGQVVGRLRANGYLTKPMTWRADMLLAAEDLVVQEEHGSHDVVFDEVFIPAVFRQGRFQWSGVRLVGEDVSILGNGMVSIRDGALAVVRIVVSPEVAAMLSRGLYGANVVATGRRWWQNLDTPDRLYRDLVISGELTAPMVNAGHEKMNMSAFLVIQSVLKFIRQEMKEQGKELEPFPHEQLLQGGRDENH